jgi:hypothetical protein
MEDGSC